MKKIVLSLTALALVVAVAAISQTAEGRQT